MKCLSLGVSYGEAAESVKPYLSALYIKPTPEWVFYVRNIYYANTH
jgi:hypothetical protein